MPIAPEADDVRNSLREALLARGFTPDADGVMQVPLYWLPNTGGELLALRKPGCRFIELAPGEDHMLSDEAWEVLTAPPVDVFEQYRDL
jgi:hypothetical protein